MAEYKKRDELLQENEVLSDLVVQYREELAKLREHGTAGDIVEEPTLLEDPFDNHNAFKVHGEIEPDDNYPNGAVIQWKNPEYRARRTWRGWVPFEWGDEYTGKNGELLDKYIPDPPKALQGPDRIDNYVRRGDVVLARLDKDVFMARQQKRLVDSRMKMQSSTDGRKTVLAEGVEIFGPGSKDSRRPAGGFRPEKENVDRPKATVLADGTEREV